MTRSINTNTVAQPTTTVRAAKVTKASAAATAQAAVVAQLEAVRAEHAQRKARAASAPKAALKATVTEDLGAQEEVAHSAFDEFQKMFSDFKLPSGKRMLVSVVVQFFTIASGVYSGFQVAAMLSLAAVAFTGSAFLAFVAYLVAAALAVYASLIASARIGRYIALGEIDQDIKRARSWIGSKFSSLKARLPGAKDDGEQHA